MRGSLLLLAVLLALAVASGRGGPREAPVTAPPVPDPLWIRLPPPVPVHGPVDPVPQ